MTDQKYSDQVEAEGKMVRRLGLYCARESGRRRSFCRAHVISNNIQDDPGPRMLHIARDPHANMLVRKPGQGRLSSRQLDPAPKCEPLQLLPCALRS